MSATKIRSDFPTLNQIAQTFGREAETNRKVVQTLKQAMDVLQGGDWMGKGAAKFYGEMNSAVLPSLQRLVASLESAQQVTTKISGVMQQAENDAAALFRIAGGGGGNASGGGGTSGGGGGGGTPGGGGGGSAPGGGGGSPGKSASGPKNIDKTKSVEILNKAFGKYATIKEGKVEVLSQADFQKAYDKIYGSTQYSWDKYVKPKFGNLEGFADTDNGINYINQDNLSVDTVPHEMLHNNTHAKFSTFAEGNINEGVTEYLTIKAVTAEGITPSHSYPNEEGVVRELVKVVGEDTLLNAYFKGETDALKTAMESKSKGSWADFKTAMDASDWTKAKALLAKK